MRMLTDTDQDTAIRVRLDRHEVGSDDGDVVVINREDERGIHRGVDQSKKISYALENSTDAPIDTLGSNTF